jgi:hypothetical protein
MIAVSPIWEQDRLVSLDFASEASSEPPIKMKTKSAKPKSTKPTLKVRDLNPKGDPRGGMSGPDYSGKGRWTGK